MWEAEKSKIKVLTSVPGEGSFHGLQTSTFLLCPEMAERGAGEWAKEEERERKSVLILSSS